MGGVGRVRELAARQRILEAAQPAFVSLGYAAVTMERLAEELGMSKKTLYQHFPSKEALLQAVVDHTLEGVAADFDVVLADATLAFPARLERCLAVVADRLAPIRTPAMLDIKRRAPRVWEHAVARRRELIGGRLGALVQAGVEAGMVRRDLPPTLMIGVMVGLIDQLGVPEVIGALGAQPRDFFRALTGLVFEGILTEAARAALPTAGRER